jgi:hypothetical protein
VKDFDGCVQSEESLEQTRQICTERPVKSALRYRKASEVCFEVNLLATKANAAGSPWGGKNEIRHGRTMALVRSLVPLGLKVQCGFL